MPKFSYIVLNAQKQQLSGTINAPDEATSRQELNQLGFSVINIVEIPDETSSQKDSIQQPKFEFAATDKSGKKVVGTIQALDQFEAYKRLVKEYEFEVDYLIDASLQESKKVLEKMKGVFELQNRLDQESQLNQANNTKNEASNQDFESKQAALKEQVEFVLQKVKAMLDLYEPEIKADKKQKMRQMVDKVLRIRNSTNLDYIRTSCEELLSYIQKEEIFINEDLRQREHMQMTLQAKTMMMQLHRNKNSSNVNITQKLYEWRELHINGNDTPSISEKIINFAIGFFIGFESESPELKELRLQKMTYTQQIKQYLILYYQSPSVEFKNETKAALKKIWAERKNTIHKIKDFKHKIKLSKQNEQKNTTFENIIYDILNISGWLLTFYLVYYFCTKIIINKSIGLNLPKNILLYNTAFLKYFLTTLFLFYSGLKIKMEFFKRNSIASLVLVPTFILSSIFIYLNF